MPSVIGQPALREVVQDGKEMTTRHIAINMINIFFITKFLFHVFHLILSLAKLLEGFNVMI